MGVGEDVWVRTQHPFLTQKKKERRVEMIRARELDGVDYIERKGEVSRVKLPKGERKTSSIRINVKTKEMYFVAGEETYIIDKTIGIRGRVVMAVSKAGEYLIIELVEGHVYRETEKGVKCVHIGGKQVKEKQLEGIRWETTESVMEHLAIIVQGRYNIPNKSITRGYIDNLTFLLEIHNTIEQVTRDKGKTTERVEYVPTYALKLQGCYDDLGLNVFDYKVYEEESKSFFKNKESDIEKLEREKDEREQEMERKRELKLMRERESIDGEMPLEEEMKLAGFSIETIEDKRKELEDEEEEMEI